MAATVAEVAEADAEGKVKKIYDDIKITFRVPIVNLVFRVLATHPDYLELAWRALKPNVQTVYFETRADELRARAVEDVASLASPSQSATIPEDARPVLQVFHYVNPKLVLAVAALRSATHGLQPKLMELPPDAKRQLATGVPNGLPEITMVDPEEAGDELRSVFNDIRSTLGLSVINSDYRALARWPEYLTAAWHAWKPQVGSPGYRELERELRRMADNTVTALPFRMDLHPHTLRHAGLSESEIDAVQSSLRTFSGLLPGLVAAISFFEVGAEGKETALRSPFPARPL